jgi:hypothetical protein
MDSRPIKQDPKHGVRRVVRNGEVRHIPLCYCHAYEALPRLENKDNMIPEVQSILDLFNGHMQALDKKIDRHKDLIEKVHGGVNESFGEAVRISHSELIKRIEELESRTLWSLIKRCFTRS